MTEIGFPRKVAVLGATGSIGRNTLNVIEVVSKFPYSFEVVLLSAASNEAALNHLAKEFPKAKTTLVSRDGEEAALEAIRESGADVVVNGIAGAAGLRPSLAALETGADLALANKETVVMAWPLVTKIAAKTGSKIIPVDSEHSAVFHLLRMSGHRGGGIFPEALSRTSPSPEAIPSQPSPSPVIILTASGGPFREHSAEQLERVTAAEALRHPTWKMGAKISIDSATLANKGLEVIEAVRLFDTNPEHVRVVIHPQSVVHALVSGGGGEFYAQMSKPDMRIPIQAALFYPFSVPEYGPLWGSLDFSALTLSFSPPDFERFPMLRLAYQALSSGPLAPAAYNAANEAAAAAFIAGEIPFTGIARRVEKVLAKPWTGDPASLEDIFAADREARDMA